jgi:polysaccharide pyruvyl transferase WcaK-like protein
VEVSSDIVCALDLPKPAARQGRPVFGLVTRKQNPGEIHWKNVAGLCDRARSLGYQIRNIVLGTGGDRQADIAALAEFRYEHMSTVESDDLLELTREIGSCDVIASMKFHGCVVATLYGVPAITMITTDKFRNLFHSIERPDLIGHHTHASLPDRLGRYMAPIPRLTREYLRENALQGLARLRRRMLDEFG